MQAQFTFQWNSKGIQADNVQGFVLYFLEKGHKFAVKETSKYLSAFS